MLTVRPCPVCGDTDDSHERFAEDIGAGNGAQLEHLAALGFVEVVGVEPSRAAADAASAAVRSMIRVERFDPGRLPPGHFTLVVANQTLEHVEAPFALLRAVRRLLKPGGALMIFEFALTRAGFGNVGIEPFANRYPLHYWTRLLPIPRPIKRPLYARLRTSPVGRLMFEARVGNLIGWARN